MGFLEDVHFYPEELLGSVYRFLGVDASFRPRGVGEKVHTRSAGRMASDAAVYLAGLYREELSRLSEHFGGYASFWLYCAEELAERPPKKGTCRIRCGNRRSGKSGSKKEQGSQATRAARSPP